VDQSSKDSEVVNLGWRVTFAGMGINLALGVLYSWSVIKKAIPSEWGWDDADKALPYSIACIVFALVMVPAGRLQDKIGPRWVATAGGILTGLGCIVASFATSVLWYVIGFGILAGAGIGLGYAATTPAAVKWFPARRTGLIAGLVVAGFGLASVYISPVANYLTGNNLAGKPLPAVQLLIDTKSAADAEVKVAQEALAAAQADPSRAAEVAQVEQLVAEKSTAAQTASASVLALKEKSIKRTLMILGIGFLCVVTFLAQLLKVPHKVLQFTRKLGPSEQIAPAKPTKVDVAPMAMLKKPQFYLLWFMFAFSSGAGLMIIGSITTIAKLGHIEAGFVLVALLAIGNASGRIAAGMLSDKIGRLWTMFIVFMFQAAMMMALRTGLSNMGIFVLVSMLLGFNYGACLSVFPSAMKDNFGLKNFGVNYGLVFTAWGVGGLVFPQVAGRMFEAAKAATGTGSYNNAYLMAAALLCVAAALTFATRSAEKKNNAAMAAAAAE